MARPKKPGFARHVQITPYVWVQGMRGTDGWDLTYENDARVDRALAWLKSQPKGTVQGAVWQLVVAAVNGELGVAQPIDLGSGNDDEARKALETLLDNMILEEE